MHIQLLVYTRACHCNRPVPVPPSRVPPGRSVPELCPHAESRPAGSVREVGGGADRGGRGAGVGARTGACVRLRHLCLSASRALALALCHSRYLVLPCLHLTSTNVHPHFVGGAVAQPAGVGPCLQLVVDSTCLPPFAFPRRSGRRCGATCRSGGAPCSASTSTLAATRAWPSCRTSVSL